MHRRLQRLQGQYNNDEHKILLSEWLKPTTRRGDAGTGASTSPSNAKKFSFASSKKDGKQHANTGKVQLLEQHSSLARIRI